MATHGWALHMPDDERCRRGVEVLVEGHLFSKQKVAGSSPVSLSTKKEKR